MTTCPVCNREIPPGVSVTCPHCHAELPAPPVVSGLKIVLTILAGFAGLLVCGAILLALIIPPVEQGRQAAREAQLRHNLKQLELALKQYRETQKVLPPVSVPSDGERQDR